MEETEEMGNTMEEEERFIKEIAHYLAGLPDKEKIAILTTKLRYWYRSAREWKSLYEELKK